MSRFFLFILLVFSGPFAFAGQNVILVVGDSLSAGHGIELEQGWVALLRQKLKQQGYPHQVVNASISGDTTSAALSRLPAALQQHDPEVVIIELGGNDGLRGLPLGTLKNNLAQMIQRVKKQGARVLLLGMRLPPNYGPAYTRKFSAIYRELASQYETAYVPFFLEGIAEDLTRMQPDGIHPLAEAHPVILQNVWPALENLLAK